MTANCTGYFQLALLLHRLQIRDAEEVVKAQARSATQPDDLIDFVQVWETEGRKRCRGLMGRKCEERGPWAMGNVHMPQLYSLWQGLGLVVV